MHTLLLDSLVTSWERDSAPVERLRTLVLGMLERIDENPAFFRLTFATQAMPGPVGTTLGAELNLIGLDIAGLIHDVIEQGTASGAFRLLDPDKATTFVGQQLYGAMSVRAGEPDPAPLEEAADELCTFLLHGLAGPGLVSGPDARPDPGPDDPAR
jgi:AcrR family transcriptional regulator